MKLQHNNARYSRSTRPIWFVAMMVTASVLGWMHRLQSTSDQEYIMSLVVDHQSDEDDVAPRRSMLRDTMEDKSMLREMEDKTVAEEINGEAEEKAESDDELKVATLLANIAIEEANAAKAKQERLQKQVEKAAQSLKESEAATAQLKAENHKARAGAIRMEAVKARLEAEITEREKRRQHQPAHPETPQVELSVATPKTTTTIEDRQVHFMPLGQVNEKDAFSASWLQRTEDFLSMELDRIMICEDAAFRAFRGNRRKMLRMTLDWFDFSLEHLSKWWKMLQIFRSDQVYNTAMERFDSYLGKAATFELEKEQSFIETIAVIAYQPYKDGKAIEQAYNLTLKSLGATIESLRRAGFGRVVVVGDGENDPQLTQDTFRHLQKQLDPSTDNAAIITKVGHMEVGYAKFNPQHAVTKRQEKNVPKATLDGLKEAFVVSKKSERTPEEEDYIKVWLGEKLDWKYVYLTEPDSILQFRTSTLKQLKKEIDGGSLLVPHRLQPVPHETDARGWEKDFLYLPEEDFPVLDLDGENDSCCDAHLGPQHKPGQKPNHESCGNFWYMCDFTRRKPKAERTHKRIKEYSLMRLTQGTGIVSLTGAEHGRPCLPKKNGVCLPP